MDFLLLGLGAGGWERMEIREYRKEDEREVKEVILGALKEIYRNTEFIKWEDFDKYLIIYVAEVDGRLCGLVAIKKVDDEATKLKRMYVLPAYQRKGVGKRLLDKSIEFSIDKGVKEIILTTYPEMKSAIEFYKKNGFEIVENPEDRFFTDPSRIKYNKRQTAMRRKI